jgi:HK97 family phage prohead protease
MIVEGHFTTFNEEYLLFRYEDYEFYEQIDRHAFDNCDLSDVIMQYDHNGRVFARTRNDTLRISFDDKGGFMRSDLSKASGGKGLYHDIKYGLIDRMSFAFTVQEHKIEEIKNEETGKTKVLRTITDIEKLYDVSAVSIPANDGTDISARSFCDGVIAELEAERLKAQAQLEARKRLALRLRLMSHR